MMSADDAAARTRGALGALALVVFLVGGFALLPRVFSRGGAVGKEAPDFDLALVANGASIGADRPNLKFSELRGKAVLLDFWATWCEPCRMEAPIVDQLARRWRERGLVVVGVNTDSPGEGDPRAFALSRGLTYPIVRDTAGDAARAYGIEDLPTLVVVSKVGKIVAVRRGVTDDAELERLVRQGL
ncbi:MAG: redoxin domain-containing protein [Myxococcales bacterium]|nr:redoxin domain-containing protein [Myxococcales bacterium]